MRLIIFLTIHLIIMEKSTISYINGIVVINKRILLSLARVVH